MTASAMLSSKYQITIPKTVRERMSLRPGRRIAFFERADGVLLVPLPNREELAGFAKGANPKEYRDRNDRY